jgi:ferric-dicitrate binding protein FerR (iron transport regulator)
MKMFTRHMRRRLSAYCNGELSAEETRRVREHLLGCRRCRSEYDEIRLGVELARQLPLVSAPESLWNELETLLAAEEPASSPVRPRRLAPALSWGRIAVAAALLLLAAGIGLIWHYSQKPTDQMVREQDPAPVAPHEAPEPRDQTPAPKSPTLPEVAVQPDRDLPAPKAPQTPDRDYRPSRHANPWQVDALEGEPVIGSERIKDKGQLAIGQRLETDGTARARVEVADIGHVEVEPNSSLQLLRSGSTEHRLSLEKGRLRAMILAPPRLFFVNTPSAVAIDYGCAYTLTVDEDGGSRLEVQAGWVMMVSRGRESMVPMGGVCITRSGIGPGTPYFEDASEVLLNALTRFDFEGGGKAALDVVLAESRKRDTMTLINLLNRVRRQDRLRVYERLAALVPPPEGVTLAGVMRLDEEMLERWRMELTWVW